MSAIKPEPNWKRRLNLRAGEWVNVRSKEEILSTLDENGRLDQLPFMPEMFAYCGKRFRVWKRAHKTCDTVNKTGGRRMLATVHLQELRCDGTAHGGCQAACLIFWKEAWLRRAADPQASAHQNGTVAEVDGVSRDGHPGEEAVWAAVRAGSDRDDTDVTYICQATMLPEATTFLPWWDLRQYLEDWTSGNASLWQLLCGGIYVCYHEVVNRIGRHSGRLYLGLIRLYDRAQALIGGVPYPRRWGTISPGQKTPSRPLHLKPGELVQIRTYPEILSTLDGKNRNRGLYFDAEEVPYCGNVYRVRSEISRFIDEKTGKMLMLKDHNVILEGVYCQARYSDRRMLCPRAIYSFWRETWLKRVVDGASPQGKEVKVPPAAGSS
jgi:hypothetical protein